MSVRRTIPNANDVKSLTVASTSDTADSQQSGFAGTDALKENSISELPSDVEDVGILL